MHLRALFAFGFAACATAQAAPPATPAEVGPPTQAAPTRHAQRGPMQQGGCDGGGGGIQVEGQLGTIPVDNVRRVVREGNEALAQCFRARLEAVPCLSGRVELKLRVGVDGAVRWAVPTQSTMGDREVERCMMERAQALRFSAPCGGEAEVSTSIELDGGPDARAAVGWPASRVAATLRQRRAQLLACRGAHRGDVSVTVYVARDGTIAAAGSNASDPDALAVSECALREVRTWRLASPGSWYARFTFNLP